MVDTFKIKLHVEVPNDADVWVLLERGEEAIRSAYPKAGPIEALSALDAGSRHVYRPTFPKLRSALDAAGMRARSCDGWITFSKNVHWQLSGWWGPPGGNDVDFNLRGADRLKAEAEAQRVKDVLTSRGYTVNQSGTAVSSTDRGEAEIGERPWSKKLRAAGAFLAEHVALTVGAIIAGLVVIALASAWGIGASNSPSPDESPSPEESMAQEVRFF